MGLYSDEMEWCKLMGKEGTREKKQKKKKSSYTYVEIPSGECKCYYFKGNTSAVDPGRKYILFHIC